MYVLVRRPRLTNHLSGQPRNTHHRKKDQHMAPYVQPNKYRLSEDELQALKYAVSFTTNALAGLPIGALTGDALHYLGVLHTLSLSAPNVVRLTARVAGGYLGSFESD